MVFGLFNRKSTQDTTASTDGDHNARLPTPTPSVVSTAHHHSPFRFPTVLRSALGGSTTDLTLKDSERVAGSVFEGNHNDHFPAPPPPVTPSPPPIVDPNGTKTLHDLMLTIPPKTLHAYTLAHLRPSPIVSSFSGSNMDTLPRPPSPGTVSKLASFFSTLAPPPLLHCVRCHKDFHEIENEDKDKACRVPHDDESALVSRISGGGYETLWACCGQTASGDGSEGPPDGWCYEGRHTIDVRRARFRADSTMHDDKLTSCLKLNCRGIRDRLPRGHAQASPSRTIGASSVRRSNPSPARSQASLAPRSARKRPRKSLKEASSSENEADAESVVGRAAKAKERIGARGDEKDGSTNMAVDSNTLVKSRSKPKAKTRSQPLARVPASASDSTTASLPAGSTKAKPAAVKLTSRTLLSQSHTRLASDSEASARERPRTRSHVREESRGRTTSKLTRADISERAARNKKLTKARSRSPTSEEHAAETESDREERGRDRKKRRVGRG